jgi:putative ABC transport system permease protein
MSLAERLYRLTLSAYPSHHRKDYGPDMLGAFRALERDFRARGRVRYAQFLLAELRGLVSEAARERFTRRRVHSFRGPSKRGRSRKGGVTDGWIQDLRYGWRQLRSTPGVTTLAVLTLALGIGANSTIFSVVDAVMDRPVPYEDPDRLVSIFEHYPVQRPDLSSAWGLGIPFVSTGDFLDYSEFNNTFEYLAATSLDHYVLDGMSTITTGLGVSEDFLPMLGVQLQLGRRFSPDPLSPTLWPQDDADFEVILSHGFWQRQFGGDPEILGKTLRFHHWWGRRPVINLEVVGVLAADFQAPPRPLATALQLLAPDMLVPLGRTRVRWDSRHLYTLSVIGRLHRGVALDQAQADLDGIAAGIAEAHPETNAGYQATVVPLQSLPRGLYGSGIALLMAVVGVVLLIACVNVATLLLARWVVRGGEFAVRASLGAGRARIFRQLLIESGLLATLAGVAALLVAYFGTAVLTSLFPGNVLGLADAAVNWRVVAFTGAASLLTVMLFGVVPALWGSGIDAGQALKRSGGGSVTRASRLLRGLVVSQVALALTLLIGAGLLINSFARLASVDLGFDHDEVLMVDVSLPPWGLGEYQSWDQITAMYREITARVEAVPGVLSVSSVGVPPLNLSEAPRPITIDDRPRATFEENLRADFQYAGAGYFRTMGIPLVRGREFTEQDDDGVRARDTESAAAVVSEAMARQFWPGKDPIGKTFYWGQSDLEAGESDNRYPPSPQFTVVGVVGDVKTLGLDMSPRPQVYSAAFSYRAKNRTVMVRTAGDPLAVADAVRRAALSVNENELTLELSTMDSKVSTALDRPRFYVAMAGTLATVALILAVAGLYGVGSYLASCRTHEFGLRIAMGARPGNLLKMVMRQGMMLVGAGVAGGLIGAVILTRFLSAYLFGISPGDPITFGVMAAVLAGVALIANAIPARRASRIDPIRALRGP